MCGDEWEDEEHTEVLDGSAPLGMVESMDELKLRTAREGGTCFVRSEACFYTFTNGEWVLEDDDDD